MSLWRAEFIRIQSLEFKYRPVRTTGGVSAELDDARPTELSIQHQTGGGL